MSFVSFYLSCLPAPLPIFGIVGEPPHVPVGLDDLWPQDVVLLVLPHGHRLQAVVELEGLRAELQHFKAEGGEWGQGRGMERRQEREKGREDRISVFMVQLLSECLRAETL